MDRFFSKLDLRDIKIDPERSRFLPDDDVLEEPALDVEESVGHLETETWTEPDVMQIEDVEIIDAEDLPEPDFVLETVVVERTVLEEVDKAAAPANEVLKVSARSRPSAVAGAIAGVVREVGRAEVQAIGAGATNQAIKAVAIARDYLRESGIDAVCLPEFIDITIDDEDRTAIRMVVEPR